MITYLIRTTANLHAGAGDNSFGIVDRHVQRDHTTDLPVVFASSLKGSLREAYLLHYGPTETASLFGSDNRRGKAAQLQQGALLLSDAKLLTLPARSTHQLFFNATTPELLKDFLDALGSDDFAGKTIVQSLAKMTPAKGTPLVFGATATTSFYLETLPQAAFSQKLDNFESLSDLLGTRLALLHVDDFAALARELPVVARNSLDNGVSQNLWYEEVVPRESRFYTTFTDYGIRQMGTREKPIAPTAALEQMLQTASHQLQIGANATVGYGQTRWTKIN